jgi:hypothetical protein
MEALDPGERARFVEELWLLLSPEEVRELHDHLCAWLRERPDDPEWHFHISDALGRGLNVGVMDADDPRYVQQEPSAG